MGHQFKFCSSYTVEQGHRRHWVFELGQCLFVLPFDTSPTRFVGVGVLGEVGTVDVSGTGYPGTHESLSCVYIYHDEPEMEVLPS